MDCTDRDGYACCDGANRLAAIASSQDRRTFVVVDDSRATIDVAALACSNETVSSLAHEVAASGLGQSEREVEDQQPLEEIAA